MSHEVLTPHVETARTSVKNVKKGLARSPLLLGSLLLLSACSPKSQSFWGADVNMGSLPDDICRVNGEPKIVSISTESKGDVQLVYVNRDGNIVSQQYTTDITDLNTSYKPRGKFVWKGGHCPPSETPTPAKDK